MSSKFGDSYNRKLDISHRFIFFSLSGDWDGFCVTRPLYVGSLCYWKICLQPSVNLMAEATWSWAKSSSNFIQVSGPPVKSQHQSVTWSPPFCFYSLFFIPQGNRMLSKRTNNFLNTSNRLKEKKKTPRRWRLHLFRKAFITALWSHLKWIHTLNHVLKFLRA